MTTTPTTVLKKSSCSFFLSFFFSRRYPLGVFVFLTGGCEDVVALKKKKKHVKNTTKEHT